VGRKKVVPYSLIRVARRGILLAMIVAIAAIARLSLDVALVLNLVALVVTAILILWVAARDDTLGFRPSARLLAEELRFGTRSLPGRCRTAQFRGDAFLINIILGVRQTGIYSVTSGLAETLWYIPNAMGTVMFSRAVDPKLDAGRIARS
jgi:O-antigen/teichoic acid export membrane protein